MTRVLALLAFFSAPAAAEDLDALFKAQGEATKIDWLLIKAVATVESHLNPRAVNRRDPSFGLMQIHCVADQSGACRNRLDVEGWAGMTRDRLMDPAVNVRIGAQVLAWNIRTFGRMRGIAVYNSWSARLAPRGATTPNQFYVDRVLKTYLALIVASMPKRSEGQIVRSASRSQTGYLPPVIEPSAARDAASNF